MIKELPWRFQQCLGPFSMLAVKPCSDTGLFKHLSNHVFHNLWFRNMTSCELHDFLQNVRNLLHISELKQKILKDVFVS